MTTTTQGSEESSNTPAEPNSDSLEHWLKDIRTDLNNDPPDWAPGDSLDGAADHMEGEVVSVTDTVLPGGSEGRPDELAEAEFERTVPTGENTLVEEIVPVVPMAPVIPGAPAVPMAPVVPGAPVAPMAPLKAVDVSGMPPEGAIAQDTGARPLLREPEEALPAPVKPRVGRHRAPDPDDD